MELHNFLLVIGIAIITCNNNTLTHGASVPDAETKHPCSFPEDERYYNVTKRCYNSLGEKGPCGDNMVLSAQEGTPYADCKCKPPVEGCVDRPLVHWSEKSQCYFIFDQGPCQTGEWLILDGNSTGKCEVNPCLSQKKCKCKTGSDNTKFTFFHNGTCYKTGTRGFCGKTQKMYFVGGSSKPTCFDQAPYCAFGIALPPILNCANGQVRDSTGGCEPVANFL